MKKLLGDCPVCGERVVVTELKCEDCNTTIRGEFPLSKFDYLTNEEQNFALVFIKNAGNIKAIEKDLNISYPTVKKMLDEVIVSLGFETKGILNEKLPRDEILRMLKQGDIDFDEAEKLLEEDI